MRRNIVTFESKDGSFAGLRSTDDGIIFGPEFHGSKVLGMSPKAQADAFLEWAKLAPSVIPGLKYPQMMTWAFWRCCLQKFQTDMLKSADQENHNEESAA